jgi:hypothetical protein
MRLISTTWDEGRLFDLWMVVHFFSGLAGGLSNVFFGLGTRGVYALGLSMLVAWEVIEHLRGVGESWENRALDLVVGVAGIAVALWSARFLGRESELLAFGACTLITLGGGALGWRAFRARTARD